MVIWSKIVANAVGAFVAGLVGSLMTGADTMSAVSVGGTAAVATLSGLVQQAPYKPEE